MLKHIDNFGFYFQEEPTCGFPGMCYNFFDRKCSDHANYNNSSEVVAFAALAFVMMNINLSSCTLNISQTKYCVSSVSHCLFVYLFNYGYSLVFEVG